MNERIKLLAEQALFESNFDDEQNIKITMVIFAELIVRECSRILREEANSNWEGREERLLNAMANLIEVHFGVEE